jgi:adenosine kinase
LPAVRIAVSGSIATDHLMSFDGRFAEQLLPDQLDHLSVSFLVDDLQVRRGGVAANICYGMALLGLHPVVVGAVGADFGDEMRLLELLGVDTAGLRVSTARHTARFVCTTDRDQNQIASFYPGAMSEAREIDLGALGPIDLVVISPNDPAAMTAHTRYCRENGVAFAADPSQQLASIEDEAIRDLLDGADLLFGNAYEAALLERKTGWSPDEVLRRVGTRVTTHGADGIVVQRAGEPDLRVGVVAPTVVADPTGVGDAFRAGFLTARSWGFEVESCVRTGALLATSCLETTGPQEYQLAAETAAERLRATYGSAAAEEIVAHL